MRLGLWTMVLLCVASAGCKDLFGSTSPLDAGIDGAVPTDGGLVDGAVPGSVGAACEEVSDCRNGLQCGTGGTCEPTGMAAEGSTCQLSGDCADGLFCSLSTRVCASAGEGEDGAECLSAADCASGLSCSIEGFGARCRAGGEGDIGTPCENVGGCLSGLACLPTPAGSVCTSPPAGTVPDLPVPGVWTGEACETEEGSPRALFDVGADGDFFQLPFPNDVRRTDDGRVDYTGFATPGTALPIDVVERYLRASEEALTGFSTNATVYFRFSEGYDWDSISSRFRMVDITPDSPTYGESVVLQWQVTAGRITRYMCEDWLAFRPRNGDPLRPGTTYAAVLDRGFLTADGEAFERSEDFDAMLGDAAPSDAALARAHGIYAPLRAWIADTDVDGNTLLSASVFTTQEPETRMPRLREVIHARELPTVSDLTACEESVVSPCDDGTEQRRCGAPNEDYVEVHGRINLPVFQQGTAPYLTPEDGGGIEDGADGLPVVARDEGVCFAMTVPRTPPPTDGFPLLVYGHGTGGSFTTGLRNGIANDVIGNDGEGAPVGAVTFSIDFPQHGTRRGDSTEDPDLLFFNFINPEAARDNITQGSADLFSVVRWATEFALDAGESPTGEAVRFDRARIAFFMHSQGATHASLMFPYEPDVRAILLSGNGGDLTQSLLTKTEPVDIASIVPFALLDANASGALATGVFHPALSVFQAYFDAVDPVNFARRVHREPAEGVPGRHVFMTYGLGDTFSTEETMRAYGAAARLPIVTPELAAPPFAPVIDPPASENITVTDAPFTIALRQYDLPADVDGHFVSTRSTDGRADAVRFIQQALQGVAPSVGAP
ncbi:MAG: hypothetical protein AAF645_00135 [Myxococcota bacterium]